MTLILGKLWGRGSLQIHLPAMDSSNKEIIRAVEINLSSPRHYQMIICVERCNCQKHLSLLQEQMTVLTALIAQILTIEPVLSMLYQSGQCLCKFFHCGRAPTSPGLLKGVPSELRLYTLSVV